MKYCIFQNKLEKIVGNFRIEVELYGIGRCGRLCICHVRKEVSIWEGILGTAGTIIPWCLGHEVMGVYLKKQCT